MEDESVHLFNRCQCYYLGGDYWFWEFSGLQPWKISNTTMLITLQNFKLKGKELCLEGGTAKKEIKDIGPEEIEEVIQKG